MATAVVVIRFRFSLPNSKCKGGFYFYNKINNMAEPTDYDKLLSDEKRILNAIAKVKEGYKKDLAGLRTELRQTRKALLRYDNLTVVHVRKDNSEKTD